MTHRSQGVTKTEVNMVITRWQAEVSPTKEQVKFIYELEGLETIEEVFNPNTKIPEHRHPFCEIQTIINGELLVNISGNQLLLRSGDRIEIPANTKHSYSVQGDHPCLSLFAQKII